MSDRFFLAEPPAAGQAVLTGDEARHCSRVLRAKVGDTIRPCDGDQRHRRAAGDCAPTGRTLEQWMKSKSPGSGAAPPKEKDDKADGEDAEANE